MSITGANHLRECKNTEFEWELSKRGFVKVAVSSAVRLGEGPLGQLPRINYVARKLPTYPSPKLTLTLTSHLGQNDGLGEG